MNDIIIVGGGLAGLAAATWCARAGLRVVLLERAQRLGGRACTDVLAGHAFNQGGHALYAGGAAARALVDLGVTYTGRRPPVSGAAAISGGVCHRLPAGVVSILATDLFGFAAKIEAARALAALAPTDPGPLRDVTWRAWIDGIASRPEVRAVLDTFARLTTYGNAPYRASAGATISQIRLGIDPGVLYVDGGWQSLVDGLERSARVAGVTIVRKAQAERMAAEDSGIVASLVDGERVRGRAAILCVGPATARALLGDGAIGGLLPLRAACLDLGLSELPHPDRIFALGIDQPTYFSVHSATAHLAVSGATVHVMKYLDPTTPHDAAADERALEGVVDCVQPGWRERVTARRFLPNLVTSNALVEANTRRPAVDASIVPGAFLAGDWVGEEGMLVDAVMASARMASERAIAHVVLAGTGARHIPMRAPTMALS